MPQIIEVPGHGEVEFPDGMSDQDITTAIQKNLAPAQPQASLTDKMVGGWGGRMLLGAASPVLAATQLFGGETGRKAVADLEASKQRGMAAEGKEGFDWYGLLGTLAPGAAIGKGVAAVLPMATSVLGRAGIGAVQGATAAAAQPSGGITASEYFPSKAAQVGLGGTIGGAVPLAVDAAKGMGSAMRGTATLSPVAVQTLQEGQKAGYVVPPSSVNPSFLNNRLESIAGKAAVGQEAAKRNQEITNALVAKELGLPKGTDLTEKAIKAVRDKAGQTYSDVSAVSPRAEWALNELKQAKHDANLYFKHYDRSADPASLQKAKEASGWAHLLDNELETEAKQAGRADLIAELAKARTTIAKTYDIERALNVGDANVSAPILGRQLDRAGTAAKSGNLSTIGKMAEAFPSVMREGARIPTPGVSGTDAAASAILGTLGYGASGPAGLLAAGLPLLRGPARNMVLSPSYQHFATQGLSPQRQAMIEALMQQAPAAAGTATGRNF